MVKLSPYIRLLETGAWIASHTIGFAATRWCGLDNFQNRKSMRVEFLKDSEGLAGSAKSVFLSHVSFLCGLETSSDIRENTCQLLFTIFVRSISS